MKYLLTFLLFLISISPSNAGDPEKGKKLFYGEISFSNGGLQCMACHRVDGSGGTLGPDLTKVFTRYGGADGLKAVLQGSTAFPTMTPVYRDANLTEEEISHLTAFFEKAAQEGRETSRFPVGYFFFAFGGFLGLVFISQVVWGGRLKSVRRKLVESSRY